MKKLLLILLLVSQGAYAQKWQVGAGVGAALMSQPSEPMWLKNADIRIAPCFQAFVSRGITKRVRMGISVTAVKLFLGSNSDLIDINANPVGKMKTEYIIGRPSIVIMPFIQVKSKGLYAGLQAGIFTSSSGTDEVSYEKTIMYYGGNVGYGGGLHFGYEHGVAKRIIAFVEPRFNYMHLSSKAGYSMNFIEGQACIGIKLSL